MQYYYELFLKYLFSERKPQSIFSSFEQDEISRQYELLNSPSLIDREFGEDGYSKRDPFQRDYTRILYSSAFRRLQGKMQVLGIQSTAFFRNRLTHSLEVAQIAKSIAILLSTNVKNHQLYGNDLSVLEAAALAHDIGHPAFGHKGERVLDEIAKEHGMRFEGNAQNFRILRTLEKKEPTIKGINLTNRTLLAINKYLVTEDFAVKKFMYKDDYTYLNEIRKNTNLERTRTLDAQIVELSDDIAYAIHDLEDALSVHYFTIDELLYQIKQVNDTSYNLFNKIVDDSKKYAMTSSSYNTIQEYSQVFRKSLTSTLTHLFVNDIKISAVSDLDFVKEHGIKLGQYELTLNKYKQLVIDLRRLIFNCINRSPDISIYESRGEVVIKSLFSLFSDDKINKNGNLLPPDYRPNDKYSLIQGSIDYISGMMDTYAIAEYEKYFGVKFDLIPIKHANF